MEDVSNFLDRVFSKEPLEEKDAASAPRFSEKDLGELHTEMETIKKKSEILFGKMDELKLRGFYVDIVKGKIITLMTWM